MKKLIIFRHGETDWNLNKICLGSKHDISLNKTGIAQAEDLAKRLEGEKIDLFFSSPLSRAKKTAEIVNEYHNHHINIIDDLTEIDYGDASGMHKSDAFEKYADIFENWMKKDISVSTDLRLPNGESKGEFFQRISEIFHLIATKNTFECAVIATHSGVIWNFFQYQLGVNLNPVQHCTAYNIYFDDEAGVFTQTNHATSLLN